MKKRDFTSINVGRYLERIGCNVEPRADLETLRALQLAHVTSIPYENIDARLGRQVSLRLDDVEAKLVGRNRGGWCYEQAVLFEAVLTELGFTTRCVRGTVRYRFNDVIDPHMVLITTIDGIDYLTEVGFGGLAPLFPVRFDAEEEEQFHLRYRIARRKGDYLLQCWWEGDFRTVYAFTLDDYSKAARERDNAEGCIAGPSRPIKVHLIGPESRYRFDSGVYRELRGLRLVEQRAVRGEALIELLAARFGIVLLSEDATSLIAAESSARAPASIAS